MMASEIRNNVDAVQHAVPVPEDTRVEWAISVIYVEARGHEQRPLCSRKINVISALSALSLGMSLFLVIAGHAQEGDIRTPAYAIGAFFATVSTTLCFWSTRLCWQARHH